MTRELVVLAKRSAAQGRGLGAAREKAAAHNGTFERILRGTGVGVSLPLAQEVAFTGLLQKTRTDKRRLEMTFGWAGYRQAEVRD